MNALTLYGVFTSELIVTDGGDAGNTLMKIFGKLETLANENYQQAVVLSGMLFTLFIWVISFLSLLMAGIFYVFFLWHYIPKQDGGLSGYCERKINRRLMKIVSVKVNKAIEHEEEQRVKAERKAAKKAGELPQMPQKATLPTIPNIGYEKEDKMPSISRADTMATLPMYTSRPQTPSNIEMTAMNQKRPGAASRKGTQASQNSYSSRTPLVDSAAGMGRSSPTPTLPQIDMQGYPPARQGTAQSVPTLPQIDMQGYPPARQGTAQSNRSYAQPQPQRIMTNNPRYDGSFTQTPGPYSSEPASYYSESGPAFPPPIRSPTAGSMDGYGGRPTPRPTNQSGPRPGPPGPPGTPGAFNPYGRPTYDDMNGPTSPTQSIMSGRGPIANGAPRPGYPGRPTYDDGMGGRSSPAPSTFSNRGPPQPGYPGRPTYDDGMGGRSSPAPSTFANRGPAGNAPRAAYPGRPTYDEGASGRASPAPSTFSNRGPPANAPRTAYPGRPTYDEGASGRASPAPSTFSNGGPPANEPTQATYNGPAYTPSRSATNPVPPSSAMPLSPRRNNTAPMPPRPDDYVTRPGTSSSQRSLPSRFGGSEAQDDSRGPAPR